MTVLSQSVDSWMLDNPNKTLTQLGALSYLARQFGEKYGWHRHGQHNLIRQIRHDDAPDDWGAPPFVRQGVFDAINRQWQERCAVSRVVLNEHDYIMFFGEAMIVGFNADGVAPVDVWGQGTLLRRLRYDRCLIQHLIAYTNRL